MVISRCTDQVNNVLITAGTISGTNILLAKHGVVFVLLFLLQSNDHIVKLFELKHRKWVSKNLKYTYALLKCCNLLLQSILVGDQVFELVNQILQPLHHALL